MDPWEQDDLATLDALIKECGATWDNPHGIEDEDTCDDPVWREDD